MSSDAARPPPSRRRSATVRAVALVTVGLGAVGCDDPPPDLPGQTQARIDSCRAAHVRLGEDPARCDRIESAIAGEHAGTRPRFTTVAACETLFGTGACEGETLAATGPGWRPALAGWTLAQGSPRDLVPVVRDRAQQYWALSEPVPSAGGAPARLSAPRAVTAISAAGGGTRTPQGVTFAYYRLAPIYPDEETCAVDWERCERFDTPLPNRFATQEGCQASWGRCIEVEVADVLPVAAAAAVAGATAPSSSSGSGGSRSSWWVSYNSGWRDRYGTGVGPRYQGWTWTANRQPTPAYRPAAGTGPLRAWDSGSNRLGVASRMSGSPGGTTSRFAGASTSSPSAAGSTSSVSRAGFGSTGRSYSSGG